MMVALCIYGRPTVWRTLFWHRLPHSWKGFNRINEVQSELFLQLMACTVNSDKTAPAECCRYILNSSCYSNLNDDFSFPFPSLNISGKDACMLSELIIVHHQSSFFIFSLLQTTRKELCIVEQNESGKRVVKGLSHLFTCFLCVNYLSPCFAVGFHFHVENRRTSRD